LLTEADPAQRVLGRAADSHPKEVLAMRAELHEAGVEIVVGDSSIAYALGTVPGRPGQFHVTPDASYSAWLHEYQHFLDDKAGGWRGMKQLWDKELRTKMEQRAYQKEIDLMRSLGHEDVATCLQQNLAREMQKIQELY